MIDAELQAQDLERLNATFALYAEYNRRDLDELLARKGRDLGIKLYQGYRAPRPRKNFGVTELRRRTRAGEGTRVRDLVLRDKWTNRIPRAFPLRGRAKKTGIARPLSRWQMLVGQEVLRRQAGRGYLAASFLWFRARSSQARGTYYVRNKVASVLGRVDATTESFRIRAFPGGLAVIDARYGIVRRAINRSEQDMRAYIERKQLETLRRAITSTGLPARTA